MSGNYLNLHGMLVFSGYECHCFAFIDELTEEVIVNF